MEICITYDFVFQIQAINILLTETGIRVVKLTHSVYVFVGEVFFGVSGVLAVVVLGVTLNSEKTSISPEVEKFLHR